AIGAPSDWAVHPSNRRWAMTPPGDVLGVGWVRPSRRSSRLRWAAAPPAAALAWRAPWASKLSRPSRVEPSVGAVGFRDRQGASPVAFGVVRTGCTPSITTFTRWEPGPRPPGQRPLSSLKDRQHLAGSNARRG